jgi:3',5'-cyclic-nucleotide phosphodiesterase
LTVESAPVTRGSRQVPTPEELHGILNGLSVYIIHCKSDFTSDKPIRNIIAEQVNGLVREKGLGARIFAVEQGTLIRI